MNTLSEFRAATLCRLGWHCRRDRRVRKYDGGRYPELCRHCYLILGTWRPSGETGPAGGQQ